MSKHDVSVSDEVSDSNAGTVLNEALQAIEQWRKTKQSRSASIPPSIWQTIFSLTPHFSDKKLRLLFGLTKKQYEKNRKKFASQADDIPPVAAPSPETDVGLEFVQVTHTAVPAQGSAPVEKVAWKNTVDWDKCDTVVLEYVRPDGAVLRVHTQQGTSHGFIARFFSV